MISCSLPLLAREEDQHVIVAQEVAVDRMLLAGELLQYAVSEDEGRWWAILTAQTEWHARQLVATLPWNVIFVNHVFVKFQFQKREEAFIFFSLN